ncbi:MAG: hypothetical protein ACRDZ7_15875 [Acidimicrobiia bacterium]
MSGKRFRGVVFRCSACRADLAEGERSFDGDALVVRCVCGGVVDAGSALHERPDQRAVSVAAPGWVARLDLTPSERAVLHGLYRRATDTAERPAGHAGPSWVRVVGWSRKTLADEAGVSLEAVDAVVRRLRRVGAVAVEQDDASAGELAAARYWLAFDVPWKAAATEAESRRGVRGQESRTFPHPTH